VIRGAPALGGRVVPPDLPLLFVLLLECAPALAVLPERGDELPGRRRGPRLDLDAGVAAATPVRPRRLRHHPPLDPATAAAAARAM